MKARATQRTLSRNEAKIVLEREWQGKRSITLAEISALLRSTPGYARFVAHRLVRKGWLERVRRGIYRLIPADRGPQGIADTHPLIAGSFLGRPHFYSFGTACSHHGLTQQVFSEITVACQEPRRPLTARAHRYVFVRMPADRFFGFEESRVLGEAVPMADRERAMLDALDRPDLAGGIGEVSGILRKGFRQCHWGRLGEYLRRRKASSLAQRLGYFMDLHHAPAPQSFRRQLRTIVRESAKIHLGSRKRWGSHGTLAPEWNVVVNVPRDVLLEKSAHAPRGRAP